MDKNKSLMVGKKKIWTKIIYFFRGFLKNRKKRNDVNDEKSEKKETRESFLNAIKEEQDEPEIVRLQQEYENNKISVEDISYEQILSLNKLYKKQIKKINEELNMKKVQINILQKKMAN